MCVTMYSMRVWAEIFLDIRRFTNKNYYYYYYYYVANNYWFAMWGIF